MAITLGHRWSMRSNLQQSNGLESSQVMLILSPKQRAKPKTSARKTGSSMPHCVERWVWLLRVLRSDGEWVAWPSVCSRRAELVTRGRPFVQFHASWLDFVCACVCRYFMGFFKSTNQDIFWKSDLNLPNKCFRLSIWPNGHREWPRHQKWYGTTQYHGARRASPCCWLPVLPCCLHSAGHGVGVC